MLKKRIEFDKILDISVQKFPIYWKDLLTHFWNLISSGSLKHFMENNLRSKNKLETPQALSQK